MSVRLESANSERLSRAVFTSGAQSADETVAGWFYLHSLPSSGNYAPLFGRFTPSQFTGYGVFVDSNGKLVVRDDTSGTYGTPGATTVSTGAWHYLWCRRVGTAPGTINVYLDESTSVEATHSAQVATGDTALDVGSNEASYDTDYYANASFFNWHFWSTDRPASEAATQAYQAAFVTAGLARWLFDTFTDIDDDEGSLDLTATGTHSEGPTNPWGGAPPAVSGAWVNFFAVNAVAVNEREAVVSLNQNVDPTGIATAEAFGTTVVDRPHVDPSGIASAQAFGTASIAQTVNPSGVASAQAFGSPSLDLTVNPSGIASAQAFGTPVVDRPHVDPSSIATAEAFGTPTVGILHVVTGAGGIASAEAFGTTVVDRPHVDPSGIASAQAFGTPVVEIAGGTQELTSVGGIASGEAFGTAIVDRPHINPTGIASAQAFGAPSIGQHVNPTGIGSVQAFGTPVVEVEAGDLELVGVGAIASQEAWGSPSLAYNQYLDIPGISSGEQFGGVIVEREDPVIATPRGGFRVIYRGKRF